MTRSVEHCVGTPKESVSASYRGAQDRHQFRRLVKHFMVATGSVFNYPIVGVSLVELPITQRSKEQLGGRNRIHSQLPYVSHRRELEGERSKLFQLLIETNVLDVVVLLDVSVGHLRHYGLQPPEKAPCEWEHGRRSSFCVNSCQSLTLKPILLRSLALRDLFACMKHHGYDDSDTERHYAAAGLRPRCPLALRHAEALDEPAAVIDWIRHATSPVLNGAIVCGGMV